MVVGIAGEASGGESVVQTGGAGTVGEDLAGVASRADGSAELVSTVAVEVDRAGEEGGVAALAVGGENSGLIAEGAGVGGVVDQALVDSSSNLAVSISDKVEVLLALNALERELVS